MQRLVLSRRSQRITSINANVVYQWNSERKASASSASDKINKIKAVVDTAAMNEHELGQWLRANGVLAEDFQGVAQYPRVSS